MCLLGVGALALWGKARLLINPFYATTTVITDGEALFKSFVQDPIPEGVRDIEGEYVSWRGYTVWIKFRGNREVFDGLVKKHPDPEFPEAAYEPVPPEDLNDLLADFKLHEDRLSWMAVDPDADWLGFRCVTGEIPERAIFHLFFSQKSDTVFFHQTN